VSDDFTAKGLEMLRSAGFPVAGIHDAPTPDTDPRQALVDFLLARIAEDEGANRRGPEPESWCDRGGGLHLSHARVAAECEAKRRIVEPWSSDPHSENNWRFGIHAAAHEVVLRFLALPWADHPDYRSEWRP